MAPIDPLDRDTRSAPPRPRDSHARWRALARPVGAALALASALSVGGAALVIRASGADCARGRLRPATVDDDRDGVASRDDLALRARRLVAPGEYLIARGCDFAE